MYSVYMHTCPNGKRYIGMTSCKDMNDRWRYGHGYKHDTDFHNAIMQVESDEYESGVIAQELLKGYTYRDTVVRHSMVAVVS